MCSTTIAPVTPTPSHLASQSSGPAQELAALLSRTALGDRAAFKRLYDKTAAHLLAVVLRITRQREVAEDLLQEIYVKVWQQAGSFDAQLSQPMTWLISVARNRAIDSLRRRQTQPQTVSSNVMGNDDDEHDLLGDFVSSEPGPHELLEQAADARALRGCVGHLSAEQQQSVALAFYQGLSYSEVAEHLNEPLGTVKSWVRRGLLALKTCLERAAAQGT